MPSSQSGGAARLHEDYEMAMQMRLEQYGRAERYKTALEKIHLIARGQVTQYARAREQVERIAREALDV